MTRRPTEVQVLGVLRGAVEGSSTRYFGSLFGYPHWAGLAVRLGLVEPADAAESVSFHAATEAGREFYRRHRLDDFPGGRANAWIGPLVAAALSALDETELPDPNPAQEP